ncbi:DUF2946 family protein [Azospirillum sp. sgz302134]
MARVTAWCAVMSLLVHAVVMATHVPPPLAAALAQAARTVVDDAPCQKHVGHKHAGAASVQHDRSGKDAPPAGTPGHVTYCPICLSLNGGTLLGPASAPVLRPPMAVAQAMPPPPDAFHLPERPARPFAARAPPVPV